MTLSDGEPENFVLQNELVPKKKKGPVKEVVSGFFEFIQTYGVLPLAIGVVVGTAVNDFVKSLVDGIISPFIALITPGSTLATFQVEIHGSIFKVGMVVNALLNFVFVALTVYVVVKILLKQELPKKG